MVTRTLSKSGFLVSFSARRHTNKFLRAESLISSSFNTRILRFALIFRAIALLFCPSLPISDRNVNMSLKPKDNIDEAIQLQ